MSRFFVNDNQMYDNKIILLDDDMHHLIKVLRKKVGDIIYVSVLNVGTYSCEIDTIEEKKVVCKINEKIEENIESNINIDIIQALPKLDKFELVIQKCTELGVNKFIPLKLERSIVKLDEKAAEKKLVRWGKIAEGAAKQSKRTNIPEITKIKKINQICELIKEYDIVLVTYENEKDQTLKQVLKQIDINKGNTYSIGVVIGPEGGITEAEIQMLTNAGAKVITLGKRILRTETVSFVVSSIIMYELGELG